MLQHLRKQLGFLQRSCESFDNGYLDEGVRIAVVLRVLMHDTNRSVSLFTQIGAENLYLRTTCPVLAPSTIHFSGGLSSTRLILKDGVVKLSHRPNLEDSEPKQLLMHWKMWWRQAVYRLNGRDISRMQIALGAANKDGGAHVDERLSPEYAALREGVVNVSVVVDDVEMGGAVPDSHLADLRQMGHEVLTSPDLLALINDA